MCPRGASREAVDESKGNTQTVRSGPDVRSHGKLADNVVLCLVMDREHFQFASGLECEQ